MTELQWHNSKHINSYILLMQIKYVNTCASNHRCDTCNLFNDDVCSKHDGPLPEFFRSNVFFANDFVIKCDNSSCEDCILFNIRDETCAFRLVFSKLFKVIGENYAC